MPQKNETLKDVQNGRSNHLIKLSKVGILNLEYPVTIRRPDKDHEVILEIKMSVDIPEQQKGAHMSRFIERIEEKFTIPQETEGIEDLAEKIALDQLSSHEYAKNAKVELKTRRDYKKKVYDLFGTYETEKNRKTLRVKVVGAIACPCAIEITNGLSHNQRATITVEIETNGTRVLAEDLVETCEQSFSTPVSLMLKRSGEKQLVEKMHSNPMFVEDVVRRCVHILKDKYPKSCGKVKCVSMESIHPYDIFAEWEGVL